jgi:hypothetical protein
VIFLSFCSQFHGTRVRLDKLIVATWEASTRLPGQDIPHLLWNSKFPYRVDQSLSPTGHCQKHMNTDYALLLYSFNIYLIFFPLWMCPQNGLFPSVFLTNFFLLSLYSLRTTARSLINRTATVTGTSFSSPLMKKVSWFCRFYGAEVVSGTYRSGWRLVMQFQPVSDSCD